MSVYQFGIALSRELVEQGSATKAVVGVIMGSQSDWTTVKPCCDLLEQFEVPFEYGVVSAHRTPDRMVKYAKAAQTRGIKILITCAGGSAHLPGMVASETILPVLGFGPISEKFGSMDVIGSCVRMPPGVPLAFMGLDGAGAKNAALKAVRILAIYDVELRVKLVAWIKNQSNSVPYAAHD